LLLTPFPTFLHHIGLFFHTPCPLHYPSHSLPLPATLPTHFWFFNQFLDAFLCSFHL
jgi:hypothetical protein